MNIYRAVRTICVLPVCLLSFHRKLKRKPTPVSHRCHWGLPFTALYCPGKGMELDFRTQRAQEWKVEPLPLRHRSPRQEGHAAKPKWGSVRNKMWGRHARQAGSYEHGIHGEGHRNVKGSTYVPLALSSWRICAWPFHWSILHFSC